MPRDLQRTVRPGGHGYLCDDTGTPLVAYRGEHGASSGIIHSRTPFSVTFGSRRAATAYALHPNLATDKAVQPRIIAAHLRIEKPLVNSPDDGFIDIPVLVDRVGRANAERIALKLADHIYNTDNWHENMAGAFESVADLLERASERFGELYLDLYPILDDSESVQIFKQAGFDGAIHMGNGETFGEIEYRVFDVAQISPISVSCAQTGTLLEHFMRLIPPAVDEGLVEEDSVDTEECPGPTP